MQITSTQKFLLHTVKLTPEEMELIHDLKCLPTQPTYAWERDDVRKLHQFVVETTQDKHTKFVDSLEELMKEMERIYKEKQ